MMKIGILPSPSWNNNVIITVKNDENRYIAISQLGEREGVAGVRGRKATSTLRPRSGL
jgi:hypothetical protein